MAHIHQTRKKLLARVNRLQGQVGALAKALEADVECGQVLTQVAAVRGAVHGLMMEVVRDHLQSHVGEQKDAAKRAEEIDAVSRLLRTYVK